MTGHLHPKKSKAITVTFKAEEPVLMKEEPVIVALTQITLNDPQVTIQSFWLTRRKSIHVAIVSGFVGQKKPKRTAQKYLSLLFAHRQWIDL